MTGSPSPAAPSMEAARHRMLIELYQDFSEAMRAHIVLSADYAVHPALPYDAIVEAGDAEAAARATRT